MSRLYHAILEQQVNASKSVILAMPTVRVTDTLRDVPFAHAYTYEMRAVLGLRTTCPKNALDLTLERARRRVIEDVFGEFREPIMRVYDKLFQRDVEGAAGALAELELLMFTEKVAP